MSSEPRLPQPWPVTSAFPGLTFSKHRVLHCPRQLSRDLWGHPAPVRFLVSEPHPRSLLLPSRELCFPSQGRAGLLAVWAQSTAGTQEEEAWSPASRTAHRLQGHLRLVQPGCTLNFLVPASLIPETPRDPGLRSELIQNLINRGKGRRLGVGRGLGKQGQEGRKAASGARPAGHGDSFQSGAPPQTPGWSWPVCPRVAGGGFLPCPAGMGHEAEHSSGISRAEDVDSSFPLPSLSCGLL